MARDKEYFLENFTMLMTSGMDVFFALSVIQDGTQSRGLKKILARMQDDVDSGLPLWKALKKTHILSSHAVALIHIGEESGRLAENLNIISAQQKKERHFQNTVRSAMLYPILILTVACIVVLGIMWFILPHLASVFSQLKIQLPLITRLLLGSGIFLQNYGVLALPLIGGGIAIIIFFLFFFSKTKYIGQTIIFFIPGIKRIIQEVELSRLGSTLGILLSAGLPIVDALYALTDSTSFSLYKKFYRHAAVCVKDGASLQESMKTYRVSTQLIPYSVQSIIATGEKTGKLTNALVLIGSTYEEKSATSSKDISSLIEPVLLIVIWLGVLFVALAVILPVYRVIGGIQ